MAGAPTPPALGPTPGVLRRLACFVYEGVLLFGVWMVAGWLWSALTQQRHALHGRHGLMAFLFIVMTIYFTWFWSHGGQTVAMKAWHIRVVDRHGAELTQRRALARSLLAWIWVVPATAAAWLAGLHGLGSIIGLMIVGVLAYAALARLQPQRQFLHDMLCGTRLVDWRPPRPAPRDKTVGQAR